VRRTILVAAAVVVAAGLGAGAVALADHGSANASAPPPPAVATTEVVHTDLANTESFGGTLGFGAVTTVKGTGSGIVTSLPAVGAIAARGKALHSVNGKAVPVFFGDTPLFRPLDKPGLEGPDVTVVAANLSALGYPVTARTGPAFAAALKNWQQDAGLDPTGKIAPGQVLVVPAAVRVNSVTAQPGDEAAAELFTVTATTRVVTMPLDAGEIEQVHKGMKVAVLRPDGKSLPANVSAISTHVDGGGGDQDAQTGGPPKIDITVVPDKQSTVSDMDSAAVQVQVVSEVHKGVLAVPVGALVALKGGGYAVQVPDGTFRAVTIGMFSRELVEISGAGIAEGMTVVTTS
jgi:peptidoglycan hydrolase-like protein with peptidoglycan-binding domain